MPAGSVSVQVAEIIGMRTTPRGASSKRDWADLVMILEEKKHEAKFLRILHFNKIRFCPPMASLVLEMDTNHCFSITEEDQICPVFSVRQVVADNPGMTSGELTDALESRNGCSRRSALNAMKRAEEMGYIHGKTSGKFKRYHPGAGQEEHVQYSLCTDRKDEKIEGGESIQKQILTDERKGAATL